MTPEYARLLKRLQLTGEREEWLRLKPRFEDYPVFDLNLKDGRVDQPLVTYLPMLTAVIWFIGGLIVGLVIGKGSKR